MNRQRIRETVGELLDEIDGVRVIVGTMSFEAYAADWKTRRATERAISIISEACRRIPEELYKAAPEVPWRKIRGIGNILRHEYDNVADEVIYGIVTQDLATLRRALTEISASTDEPDT